MEFAINGNRVTVKITEDVIKLFEKHRIYCDHQYSNGPRRWKVGNELSFNRDLTLRPYSGYLSGTNIWYCGEYSYAHSSMPLDFSCGRYCSISWNVRVGGWQHPINALTTSLVSCNPNVRFVREALRDQGIDRLRLAPVPQRPTPTLGNDVWIGADVTLMGGVRVSNGAIIAAGAVVTKDVEPYSIVGGNPARFIRWRFTDELRTRLGNIKWWEYRLMDFADLDFGDPPTFVQEFERRRASLQPWEPETPLLVEELQKI